MSAAAAAYRIMPCALVALTDAGEEVIHPRIAAAEFWSVYERQEDGTERCLLDVPEFKHALAYVRECLGQDSVRVADSQDEWAIPTSSPQITVTATITFEAGPYPADRAPGDLVGALESWISDGWGETDHAMRHNAASVAHTAVTVGWADHVKGQTQ